MGILLTAVLKDKSNKIVGMRLYDLKEKRMKDVKYQAYLSARKSGQLKLINGLDLRLTTLDENGKLDKGKDGALTFIVYTYLERIYSIDYKCNIHMIKESDLLEYENNHICINTEEIKTKIDKNTQAQEISNRANKEVAVTSSQLEFVSKERKRAEEVTNRFKIMSIPSYEYTISSKLKSRNLKEMDLSDIDLLIKSEVYFANMGSTWAVSRIGKTLEVDSRTSLKGGITLLKCKSTKSFKTNSIAIEGSRFDNVYLVIDNKDSILRAFVSYRDIEDILDDILELHMNIEGINYKKINSVMNNIHFENPRADINSIYLAINKSNGAICLVCDVTELGKKYTIELMEVRKYMECISWLNKMDKDNTGTYYTDLVNGIESIIRKTYVVGNDLIDTIQALKKDEKSLIDKSIYSFV